MSLSHPTLSGGSISAQLARFALSNNQALPPHLGTRYTPDGVFLAEPGNTVVCHVPEGSRTQAAIIDVRRRFMESSQAHHLAFTPVSSLHMTVFQGIIESRRVAGYWSADIAIDTPVGDMTRLYLERLEGFAAGDAFEMEICGLTPAGLQLQGKTAADRRAVAVLRDRLADLFGYRHPDHDSYVFHITLAYVTRWFEDAVLADWQALLDECLEDLRAAVPVVELNPAAFCAFEDMNHFEELLVLDQPG